MHVYVQKSTATTFPPRPAGVSGAELSQPLAPSRDGKSPSTGNESSVSSSCTIGITRDAVASGPHVAGTTSGFPFSATYVASSAALPLPMFFTAWIASAGMNNTSPALTVAGGSLST